MKKLTLFTISMLCLSILSDAQITKGTILLGGGISAGSGTLESSGTDSKSSSFSISPTIGLTVKENTVVGLRLSYSRSSTEQPSGNSIQKQNGYSTGIFYRKYIGLGKSFYLFGEGAVYYYSNRSEFENINPYMKARQTNRGLGLSLYPGVAYAVSKRFHLELGLNNLVSLDYAKYKSENLTPSAVTTGEGSGFAFSTNLSSAAPLIAGFRFILGK